MGSQTVSGFLIFASPCVENFLPVVFTCECSAVNVRTMPQIVDFRQVIRQMKSIGMKSLYANSGAFGFADGTPVHHLGWTAGPDPTLRPAALAVAQAVPPPHSANLSALAITVWQRFAPGDLWVMPMSHWAYELDFGNGSWLATAIERIGLDPATLRPLNNAAALSFAAEESIIAGQFLTALLENLTVSDFALAFPTHPLRCTVHHHRQLWWTTSQGELIAKMNESYEILNDEL